MKKLILFIATYVASFYAFGQDQNILLGRIEASRDVTFFLTLGTMSSVADVRYHNRTLEFSIGPNLASWKQDKIRIALMPILAHDNKEHQILGGMRFLYNTAKIGDIEAYFNASYLNSFSKNKTARFLFDGEFMKEMNEILKIGIGLGAEQEKKKTVENTLQTIICDDVMHVDLRFLFHRKKFSNFSLSSFVGLLYKNHNERTPTTDSGSYAKTRLVFGIGIQYELF